MAKRHLLLFLALVMLSFNAFSQTPPQGSSEENPYLIQSVEDFNYFRQSGDKSKCYKQTADIDLGDIGTIEDAIISTTFSATYDGGGYTITYSASFQGTTNYGDYGLFSTVSGIIKNLNVNANVTFSGTNDHMQVGLLCGYLTSSGTIQSCNVSGNINSTVQAGSGGGTDAGLVVGQCDGGTIKYCNATGNVTGVGYVGGVVGQMSGSSNVLGCSFVGSVTALSPEDTFLGTEGSFAGGICGMASDNSSVDLCYVKADITGVKDAQGTTCSATILGKNRGKADVTNCYVEGTINGSPIDSDREIADNKGTIENNYYEGYPNMTPEEIAGALNNAAQQAGEDNNIHFSTVGDGDNKEVVFGQQVTKVCEAPTNLVISENAGTYTARWSEGTDNTITESKWRWTLSGGNLATDLQGTVNSLSISSPLSPSPNPYVFTVYTDCSSVQNDLLSGSASMEFNVDCPIPTELTPSNITDNGFTISWTSSADCQVILGSNVVGEVTTNGSSKTYTFTGLNPETTYNVTIKAKCGTGYVEQASITVTTAPLSAPTNLKVVNTIWQSTSGTATITWDTIGGITYEVNTAGNTKTIPYVETGLAVGNYTVKVRAKKGDKYSDWVSMPYTISNTPAPNNPQVKYAQNGNAYNVTVTWTEGSATNSGWTVNGNNVNTKSYKLTSQVPGSETSLSIVEKTGQNTSAALIVLIQVPCLPATLPTPVSTTQTTATLTFASAIENRQVIIGSDVYNAPNTTLEITGLESGTTYSYEVKEYCGATNQYDSTTNGNFTTIACYTVSTLTVSDVETNSATISWQSQSSLSGLQYQIVLKKGNEVVSTYVQSTLTKEFSDLTKATNYTVEVRETCGNGWGNAQAVSFTTLGDYSTVKTGDFNQSTTWKGGNVPDGDDGNIIINPRHIITLNSKLTLSGDCKILNRGVLQITQQGELINTTNNNNVGGIIEIETPQKTINRWTFIGAPFKNNYQLGVIKPVSGSDISVSQFVYEDTGAGDWSDEWATVYTNIGVAEGLFAWPFYGGVVTFTTYGDVCTWDETANNGDGDWKIGSYDFNKAPATSLNNDNEITVTKSLTTSSGGNWMALSNPYPFKLKVATFLADNSLSTNNPDPNSNNVIQGEVIYKFNGTSWTTYNSGDINMTEGFFVNFTNGGENTATFKKTQRLTNQAKSSSAQREFVKLALVDGKKEIDLLFAHNEKSENSYDIYDANKMFSPIEIAEPYFVTGGFDLVKEEVKELPYYATMNVRSYKDTVMSFVMKSIPDGLSVSIIDGENVINMYEGSVYTTEFLKGENEDRFKLYVRKADRLEEVRGRSVSITNCNRLVNVQSKEKDLTMDVFNAVGQIVYSTTEYNFNLASLPAGTYIVMAHNKRVNERVKIVIN